MTHKQLITACEENGLNVARVVAEGGNAYTATRQDGFRLYWSTSHDGSLLGSARLAFQGSDLNVSSITEINFCANL